MGEYHSYIGPLNCVQLTGGLSGWKTVGLFGVIRLVTEEVIEGELIDSKLRMEEILQMQRMINETH